MKVDILAIGVHPDDVELACAGTLLKHKDMGYTIGVLDLTRGELGTRGTADTRDQEAQAAAKILGLSFRVNAKMADGFFTHSEENLLKIIRVIRQCQPKIILANAMSDRHPDHGRAGKLIADACFLSGLLKIKTQDEQGRPQEKWRPKNVYHYIQDYHITPDFVIDITPYFKQKIDSILAYKTQFFNPNSSEPETPISSKEFLDFIRARAIDLGRPAGYTYAEGFTSSKTLGIQDLSQID